MDARIGNNGHLQPSIRAELGAAPEVSKRLWEAIHAYYHVRRNQEIRHFSCPRLFLHEWNKRKNVAHKLKGIEKSEKINHQRKLKGFYFGYRVYLPCNDSQQASNAAAETGYADSFAV